MANWHFTVTQEGEIIQHKVPSHLKFGRTMRGDKIHIISQERTAIGFSSVLKRTFCWRFCTEIRDQKELDGLLESGLAICKRCQRMSL